MAEKVTIHVAKTTLSKLIARVEAGEEITICRGATEVARLVPATDAKRLPPRKPGRLKGVMEPIPDDAFAPMSDAEIAEWEGASQPRRRR